LKIAGLDRLNISLDSLVPEKFRKITRGGNIEMVLKGLEAASLEGLVPLKINTVLMKGINDNEILDFAQLTKTANVHVRFIEYMPTSLSRLYSGDLFFSCNDARNICSSLGELDPSVGKKSGTARVFRIKGFYGTVGFISSLSGPFCGSCNKLRLTSDGCLKGCLHSSKYVDLKEALDKDASDEELADLIKEAVASKPKSHNLLYRQLGHDSENFSMCQIGG